MMDHYGVGPGFGIGAVPHQVLQNVGYINPLMPFSPGPLGSGVDMFGLKVGNNLAQSALDFVLYRLW